MVSSRFFLAFLAAWLPTVALATTPTVQEASQAFRQGSNAVALEKVNAFLAANPKDAQGRFLKGLILTELNRHPDAIKVFSGLTDDYPELPEPYNNLAVLYAAQADYERAKHSLEMAIRTHPSYATAHENLGDIYAKMASQAYDKALQLDKSNTSAQTKLSLIRELFSPAPRAAEAVKVADAGKPGKGKPVTKPPQLAQETTSPVEPTRPKLGEAPASDKPTVGEEAKTDTKVDGNKPAAPDKSSAKPKVPANPKSEIEQTVRAWAEAWSARDAEAYLAFYGKVFKVPDARPREEWNEERKIRVTRPEYIKVGIDKLKVELRGDTAKVRFQQNYESNILKSVGKKTLLMAREGQSWKIVEER
jgi:tetratricopeptide (TPR) repeat protein